MSDHAVAERMQGKVIVVTGASSGQGFAEAVALAAEGATVIAADIKAELAPYPPGIIHRQLDIGQPEEWRKLTSWVATEFGQIDGLVNNAGAPVRDRLLDVPLETWDRAIRINLTGAMLGIQNVAPLMTRQGSGSIVNVASLAALSGMFTAAYTAAKWGMRGLSRVASLELGPLGIRVNTIFPGFVSTPMTATYQQDFVDIAVREIPLGRMGLPQDVAPLVVFLLSDASAWISGAEISVDGGQWAHGGTKSVSDLMRQTAL